MSKSDSKPPELLKRTILLLKSRGQEVSEVTMLGLPDTESSSCWRGCPIVPLTPVQGGTAFRQSWGDCFQPNAWEAAGSFFLGCGLPLQQASSRELIYTDLMTCPHRATMKQHDSLGQGSGRLQANQGKLYP